MKKPLALIVLLALAFVRPSPACAQGVPDDHWHVTVMPYLMGASMTGTTAVLGQEVAINASASDIFSHLRFGVMGIVVARKGKWGVGGDGQWMALGATATSLPASIDVNQGGFAFYGLRRLNPVAELTFGGRVNLIQASIRVTGSDAVHSLDGSQAWFDPLVGLNLHTPESKKAWHAQVYTEFGGFGAGSTIAWQVFPTVGVHVTKWLSIDFGYRWLDTHYESGSGLKLFKYDVLVQGPVVGFAFKF